MKKQYEKYQSIRKTAEATGYDRKTVGKYVHGEPQARKRHWRTRADPFCEDAGYIEAVLAREPSIEATTVFELLCEHRPGRYRSSQLRTLQRRVRNHRAERGPEREVFFSQVHRAGEALQTDFTDGRELGVSIGGESFAHLLCHCTLPYSNWQTASVCQSESLIALMTGIAHALDRLGRVPAYSQTDNSTSATHKLCRKGKRRAFNSEYEQFCAHYQMSPRVIGVGKKEQNGDIETSNRHLKRRLNQALQVRGSRDFDSIEEYQSFVREVCGKTERPKLAEELEAMKPLRAAPWPTYRSKVVRVGSGSTVRVLANTYSVPSRLIGHKLEVRISEWHIEAYYKGSLQMRCERLLGKYGAHINYRHIIWSLVQKPGAFDRYRHREHCFPSLVFRKAYDRLRLQYESGRKADLEYLRVLHLAASSSQSAVEAQLQKMISNETRINIDVLKLGARDASASEPVLALEPPSVELGDYDQLLAPCQLLSEAQS